MPRVSTTAVRSPPAARAPGADRVGGSGRRADGPNRAAPGRSHHPARHGRLDGQQHRRPVPHPGAGLGGRRPRALLPLLRRSPRHLHPARLGGCPGRALDDPRAGRPGPGRLALPRDLPAVRAPRRLRAHRLAGRARRRRAAGDRDVHPRTGRGPAGDPGRGVPRRPALRGEAGDSRPAVLPRLPARRLLVRPGHARRRLPVAGRPLRLRGGADAVQPRTCGTRPC